MTISPKRGLFWAGILGLVLWSGLFIVAVGTSFIQFNVPAGCFYLFFIVVSTYQLRFYYKYRLIIDENKITQIDVLSASSINVADVLFAKWRNKPAGGCVKLETHSQKLVVEFGVFERPDSSELIERIQKMIPQSKQQGWDSFKHGRIDNVG